MQELLQGLLDLLQPAPDSASHTEAQVAPEQSSSAVEQDALRSQLQSLGAAVTAVAVKCVCNNPSCSNIAGASDVGLVSGRSCVCAGCLTARYCSSRCHTEAWKQHKPACRALAAVATAAAAAGSSS
jgi:hypothetical protein